MPSIPDLMKHQSPDKYPATNDTVAIKIITMITPTQHPVGHPEGLCESWLAILQIFSYLKNSIFDFGNLKIY